MAQVDLPGRGACTASLHIDSGVQRTVTLHTRAIEQCRASVCFGNPETHTHTPHRKPTRQDASWKLYYSFTPRRADELLDAPRWLRYSMPCSPHASTARLQRWLAWLHASAGVPCSAHHYMLAHAAEEQGPRLSYKPTKAEQCCAQHGKETGRRRD